MVEIEKEMYTEKCMSNYYLHIKYNNPPSLDMSSTLIF